MTVTHPLQDATRARAAVEPGFALTHAYKNKMRGTAEQCDQQGIAFIPVVAKSLGGWHKVALDQMRKLGSALARHTGQEEGETISHLLTRASVLLQKGLSALLLNRIPGHPAPAYRGRGVVFLQIPEMNLNTKYVPCAAIFILKCFARFNNALSQ